MLNDEKTRQQQLDASVTQALGLGSDDAAPPPEPEKAKAKPKGRRDLSASTLPRFLLEICDEEMEKSCKRIGFDESLQLMYRRGGFSVLVKRTAKYEVPGKDGPTVLGVETPKTLFPRGLLHSSVVAFLIVQKFALGVPHHRLEQHMTDQEVELDRGTMRRYTDEAGGALGSTFHHRACPLAKRDQQWLRDLDRRDFRSGTARKEQKRPATGL